MLALAGVDSLVLVGQKRGRGKPRSSSVVLQDFCSLAVRANRCRSASALWKLVSYRFIWAPVGRQCCLFFEAFFKCFYALFATVKAGSEIVENGLLSISERRK